MRYLYICSLCLLLSACANGVRVLSTDEFCAECQGESQSEAQLPNSATRTRTLQRGEEDKNSLFDLSISSRRSENDGAGSGGGSGIGVNSYLWRASLDTLSFIPLESADPFGGVIISDWYAPPEAANERFKVTVYILDRQLRADGLRATVFKQILDPQRGWVNTEVGSSVPIELENAILTRAREIRLANS